MMIQTIDTMCEDIKILFEESKSRDIEPMELIAIYHIAAAEYKRIHPIEAISSDSIRRQYAMAKVRDYVWFDSQENGCTPNDTYKDN